MKTVGVIPARYQSSRFPGKPLLDLNGTPMIIRVANIVEKAIGKKHTYIATDDDRIRETVESYGFNVIMTSADCLTGTDRVYEFSKQIKADIYVNIQGDEPLLNYKDIQKVIDYKQKNINYVINGMCSISSEEDPHNINIPKVLVNKSNQLIYISRLPIPGFKNPHKFSSINYKKQVCIYAFTEKELNAYGSESKKSPYENIEDIEILRFFELSIPIKMIETSSQSMAIDIPEDVEKVETELIKLEGNLKK